MGVWEMALYSSQGISECRGLRQAVLRCSRRSRVVRDAWSDAEEATAEKWKEMRLAGQPGPDLGP